MPNRIVVTTANKDVKNYWVKANKEAEFIEFCRDGVRDIAGNHILELNPPTGHIEPVDGILRWLQREGVDLARVEFYTGGVAGALLIFTTVTDPNGPDWTKIPRFTQFLEPSPLIELEFNKKNLTVIVPPPFPPP